MSLDKILDIVNLIGILGAVAVSAITLFASRRLQTMQQQVGIMTQKRSKRIDDMRKFSAGIISSSRLLNAGKSGDSAKEREILVKNVSCLTAQLQYIYEHDIELIDVAKWIENALVFADYPPAPEVIDIMIEKFWLLVDLYVGTEHERLKLEVSGQFQESGETEKEATSFEGIYSSLKQQLSEEKRKILDYVP